MIMTWWRVRIFPLTQPPSVSHRFMEYNWKLGEWKHNTLVCWFSIKWLSVCKLKCWLKQQCLWYNYTDEYKLNDQLTEKLVRMNNIWEHTHERAQSCKRQRYSISSAQKETYSHCYDGWLWNTLDQFTELTPNHC